MGGFAPLLANLDLPGAVVTADALQTTREAAAFLVEVKHAAYLFVVKANRPALLERCAGLPWHQVPELDRTRDRAYGRVEIRALKVVSVRGFGGFPHAAQVLQVTRKTRTLATRRWTTTVAYAVTSLSHTQASPARLADLIRGHWAIENGLHYVRDTTFAENASMVRTGTAPHVMACLCNLAIAVLCRAGPVNSPPRSGITAAPPTDPRHPRNQPGMNPGPLQSLVATVAVADVGGLGCEIL